MIWLSDPSALSRWLIYTYSLHFFTGNTPIHCTFLWIVRHHQKKIAPNILWKSIWKIIFFTNTGFFLLRKWCRISASSPQQIFAKKSIFPQAINFSQRNQLSLHWYKVLLRDLVNRPTPSLKDRLQSWLRCMYQTFSLFNTGHPSSKFGENRHWSADFVSYIYCCAEFP